MLNYNLSLCKISIQNYNYIWHYAAILDLSYLCNLQDPAPSTSLALSASCGLSQAKPQLNIFKLSQTNQLLTWSQAESAPSAWFSLVQLGLDLTTLIVTIVECCKRYIVGILRTIEICLSRTFLTFWFTIPMFININSFLWFMAAAKLTPKTTMLNTLIIMSW